MNITQYVLIDANSNQPIGILSNNSVIDLATLPTRNFNIKVETSGDVESVVVNYDGNTVTESYAPYAIWSNDGDNYFGWTPELRAYTFNAVPYSENSGQGDAGDSLSITVTFVESVVQAPVTSQTVVEIPQVNNNTGGGNVPPVTDGNVNVPPVVVDNSLPIVTGFTLINADTNQPIGALPNGATISLSQLPTRNINVRADISGNVHQVEVSANGDTFLELGAPYSIWRDDEGNYHNANLTAGQYTLSATPILNGQAGQGMTITITVVD